MTWEHTDNKTPEEQLEEIETICSHLFEATPAGSKINFLLDRLCEVQFENALLYAAIENGLTRPETDVFIPHIKATADRMSEGEDVTNEMIANAVAASKNRSQ